MPKNNLSVKLKIVNTSKGDITKTKEDSFQMETWDFPKTIKKGETIETTAVFLTGDDIVLSQDFGEVEYKTAENDGDLKIRAFWPYFKSEGSGTLISFPDGFIKYAEGEMVTLTIS
jgi:hypothetical protein